jgi:AcrR family transcriptional regulator
MLSSGFDDVDPASTEARVTSDPRAERTRQQIFAAIGELMSDRAATVTVHDVVRMAGISRSSFYAHFSSLDEVASQILRQKFAEITSSGIELRLDDVVVGRSAARIGYSRLIEHMVENFPLYSTALELPLTRNAFDEIVEAYAVQLLESIVALDNAPAGVDTELTTIYVAGGAMALISAWMRGRVEVSDDELVERLVDLLPTWLLSAPIPAAPIPGATSAHLPGSHLPSADPHSTATDRPHTIEKTHK